MQRSSSSLWGCELKYLWLVKCHVIPCHPPCEDVSWNSQCDSDVTSCVQSSSLWGCELKYSIFYVSSLLWLSSFLWGAITTSHSDSMSGEILAFFYLSREDSNFYKWWVIRNIPQGEIIISDRDKMFRKDVQWFWGEYVSLSWPESCTKSHVRLI